MEGGTQVLGRHPLKGIFVLEWWMPGRPGIVWAEWEKS